jgi:hypothetical protein
MLIMDSRGRPLVSGYWSDSHQNRFLLLYVLFYDDDIAPVLPRSLDILWSVDNLRRVKYA